MQKDRPANNSLPSERLQYIQRRLKQDGRVVAAALAQTLGVSEDSIRRDLRELAANGICQRVYGGAIAMTPNTGSFSERRHENTERKTRLAAKAVSLLHPCQFIFLDAGTTNLEIARALPDMPLTVATNSIPIAAALFGRPQLEVLVIGGRMDHRIGGTLGSAVTLAVKDMHPDLCFLGACSVDIELGIGTTLAEEAVFKRVLVEQCGQTVLAITNEKLDTASPFAVAPLRDISHLIIEADADTDKRTRLAASGMSLWLAD